VASTYLTGYLFVHRSIVTNPVNTNLPLDIHPTCTLYSDHVDDDDDDDDEEEEEENEEEEK